MQELVRRRGAHERSVLSRWASAPPLHVRRRSFLKAPTTSMFSHIYGFTTSAAAAPITDELHTIFIKRSL